MEGAGNIYCRNDDCLHGYSLEVESDTKKAARNKESSGPEQFIRLMMGPDGTLWAINKSGDSLYAFKPSFAEENPTLTQNDIKTNTVYRVNGTLAVGSVQLETGTQVLFQAQQGISFASGFAVQKGATLLCRTGF